jgi:hypothetical protein
MAQIRFLKPYLSEGWSSKKKMEISSDEQKKKKTNETDCVAFLRHMGVIQGVAMVSLKYRLSPCGRPPLKRLYGYFTETHRAGSYGRLLPLGYPTTYAYGLCSDSEIPKNQNDGKPENEKNYQNKVKVYIKCRKIYTLSFVVFWTTRNFPWNTPCCRAGGSGRVMVS